jgi:methyl-accepting chemotaxis protein
MMKRVSVNVILKSMFGLMALAVVALLSAGVWNSWSRLKAAVEIGNNVEVSMYLFAALHNMRSDRSNTMRQLNDDKTSVPNPNLVRFRAGEIAGLNGALVALRRIEFPAGSTVVADFERNLNRLVQLHKEADAALQLPKAQRRAGLSEEFVKHINAYIDLTERLSGQLNQAARLQDGYVDQLMHLKELAWAMRQAAGDASNAVSNAVAGILAPDALIRFHTNIAKAKSIYAIVRDYTTGLPLPPAFKAAMDEAISKGGVFSDEHTGNQLNVLTRIIAGEKLNIDVGTWSPASIAKQTVLLQIAEIALQTAKDHLDEQHAIGRRNMIVQSALLVLALGIGGMMLLVISRRITSPLLKLQQVMGQIAQGNFNASLPAVDRSDEIGQIVSAFNTMVGQVRATIAGVKQSAREVTNASSEIAEATTDLSQRTEEQAASLEQTSASMEQISATVKKNAESAQHANKSAMATQEVADRGGDVVARAVAAMAKIEESSKKIGDIIVVIDEIARQTNLLALNAAVEAARAGEAGRGFAVVASEVRSLAQRSSQAAKDIKDLISNSSAEVKDGVELVNQAGSALNEIMDSIKTVAAIVSEIASASSEQATGLEQINLALNQMDEVTQQNSALVEENAATAKTLEHQAAAMNEQVSFFQVDEGAKGEMSQKNRRRAAKDAPRVVEQAA